MYPQVFGKYVLERELSRGGMARVVLATLRGAGGFEKRLVVKQIRDELAFDQQFIRRFVEEAKTTVALSHPNIVPVYELGVEQGTYFLAMELVEGVSVAELLRERNVDGSRRVLSPEEGAYVGVEVCRALDYAHRRMKVVHRDITPRNVMIDEEGQIKLIDFGIAAPALVAGHEILGSPGHMAPEQAHGGQLGPPTDIFAVAVLLMEAWTGAAPFRRATPEECTAAVKGRHPRPGEFDPKLLALDGAIGTAMNVDPRARQQEASELARALRTFLQGVDVADLARALGDRVRDLRSEDASIPATTSSRDPTRPSFASHGELGTKTFAARDEALSWSGVPASSRDEPPTHTRQLPESSPRVRSSSEGRGSADDPAMAIPTPLMVDVDELERIHADIAKKKASEGSPSAPVDGPSPVFSRQVDIPTVRRRKVHRPPPDSAEKLETIATRPLETPVRSSDDGSRRDVSRGRRPVQLALLALVAIAGFVLWRLVGGIDRGAKATPTEDQARVAATATTGLVVVTAPPSSSSPVVAPEVSQVSNAPRPLTTSASTPSTPAATSPSSTPAAVAPIGKAAITLLGDPGTRVSVDGASRGACPVKIALDQGPHEVRFTFDPTGEMLGERVIVKGGDHVTVRATFTGATPTVKIVR